jgi:lysozyme
MKLSEAGFTLITKFEGLRLAAYVCPAGLWTVGYGSTIFNGRRVKPNDTITVEQAKAALYEHLENEVYPVITNTVKVPLNQNQFDALCSFIYNVGAGLFMQSTLLRKLNIHDYSGASREFKRWVYAAGKKLAGLITRRLGEEALFNHQILPQFSAAFNQSNANK